MKARCNDPNHDSYYLYGGRGIKVCERWTESIENFLADMGHRPSPRHSLDRYPDQNGNYEPGNVRWATPREQSMNRCNNIYLTKDGETKHIEEWAKLLGLPLTTIKERRRRGKSDEDALSLIKKAGPRLLTFDGITLQIGQWAERLGIKPNTISFRLKRGYPIELVLSPERLGSDSRQ